MPNAAAASIAAPSVETRISVGVTPVRGIGLPNIDVEQPGFRGWAAPGGEAGDAQDPHRAVHRNGQHVPHPQFGMRLDGRLAVDPDRTLRHQPGTVGARAHHAGTPEPLVQTLPVAVLGVGYLAPPRLNIASAANGPLAAGAGVAASITGRRRRSGISIAGAGGPC
ncbi:MAG: hypothetical protein QOH05_1891 [Acetobacteraceae bacterium]|nr:hypothetical protein [Acetobacteraceae bacterium]